MAAQSIPCNVFTQYLVNQQPKYDKLIIEAIRPTDGWIGHVRTGVFPAHSGVGLFQDRFEHVYPDVTKAWTPVLYGNCLGHPCDKTEHHICWGASRLHYALEEQSWATPILCFDQMLHVTHAKEHWRNIINNILKPATNTIMSMFLRKRALQWVKRRWVSDGTLTPFNYAWQTVNDEEGNPAEVFLLTDAMPTSYLTPPMLQRQVQPLMSEGYFGKAPFKEEGNMPLLELVSDMDTCWMLDKMAAGPAVPGQNIPTIAGNFRFQQWDAANKWWRYGFSGQMGNFAIRVDPEQLRFQHVGDGTFVQDGVTYTHKFQVILPYVNTPSNAPGEPDYSAGLKSDFNPDYQDAQFRMSFIWHKEVMEALVQESTSINPEMPFASRNFGGRWQFVMDNMGCGNFQGIPIFVPNERRNKGKFIADFQLAIRPLYTEFGEAIFHRSEPPCVYTVTPCATPQYYTQHRSSSCTECETDLQDVANELDAEGWTFAAEGRAQ